jgi:Cu(I)/Ag(I) efflux system membrane fusion protein
MNKYHAVLGALALGITGFVAGVWTTTGSPSLPSGFLPGLASPAAAQTQRRPAQDDPVLFYRDPMGERVVSPRPRKDWMGMDFLPVRRSAVVPLLGRLPNPLPPPTAGETPLFYRDPMGGSAIATAPRKDSMGMDFLPIYPSHIAPLLPPLPLPQQRGDAEAPEAAPQIAEAPTAVPTVPPVAERRILYYRNPMGLPDTSPTPRQDSMGMAYIPVYADEASQDGTVGLSPARIQTLGVRTEAAERRVLARTIRTVGTVTPDERRQATVTSRFEGWIERLHVNETGREVARGEPLMEVYSPELLRAQAEYVAGQATRRPGEADTGRARLLNFGLSEAQIDGIRAAGRASRTVTIPAPISGTVMAKTALQGMMFRPGDALFSLADLSMIAVMAAVYEQDAGALRPGQPAMVGIAAFPGESFEGVVDRIYPALDPVTRTARVRVMLPNPSGRLLTGMLATVEIAAPIAGGREVVTVPASAVLDGGRRRVVLVELGGGRFRPAVVRTGARAGGAVEILEGLSGRERVVVGANFLIDAESNMRGALAAFSPTEAPGEGSGEATIR